jgi:hypothetical protein
MIILHKFFPENQGSGEQGKVAGAAWEKIISTDYESFIHRTE